MAEVRPFQSTPRIYRINRDVKPEDKIKADDKTREEWKTGNGAKK
jgi:hypothetical protein